MNAYTIDMLFHLYVKAAPNGKDTCLNLNDLGCNTDLIL